jgi:hypothetical protein
VKLSDIMSYADLSNYAEIALVLFLGVFIAITIRTFLRHGVASCMKRRCCHSRKIV